MENFVLVASFFIISYITVHGIFYFLNLLGNRAFHRQKLREVLGIGFKNETFEVYKK